MFNSNLNSKKSVQEYVDEQAKSLEKVKIVSQEDKELSLEME